MFRLAETNFVVLFFPGSFRACHLPVIFGNMPP